MRATRNNHQGQCNDNTLMKALYGCESLIIHQCNVGGLGMWRERKYKKTQGIIIKVRAWGCSVKVKGKRNNHKGQCNDNTLVKA